jgi:hypothetical protein
MVLNRNTESFLCFLLLDAKRAFHVARERTVVRQEIPAVEIAKPVLRYRKSSTVLGPQVRTDDGMAPRYGKQTSKQSAAINAGRNLELAREPVISHNIVY